MLSLVYLLIRTLVALIIGTSRRAETSTRRTPC